MFKKRRKDYKRTFVDKNYNHVKKLNRKKIRHSDNGGRM